MNIISGKAVSECGYGQSRRSLGLGHVLKKEVRREWNGVPKCAVKFLPAIHAMIGESEEDSHGPKGMICSLPACAAG